MEAAFQLGKVVITPGATELAEEGLNLVVLLARHARKDWGDLCEEDSAANERALTEGSRIFSAYRLEDGNRVWIITEADRSSTCILLPEEY